jgi:hypothetical protein
LGESWLKRINNGGNAADDTHKRRYLTITGLKKCLGGVPGIIENIKGALADFFTHPKKGIKII